MAAISIAVSSLSEPSLKQYNCSLKKWWRFCRDTNVSVLSARSSDIIKFLTKEYENGTSYGSLNGSRSAISLILGPEIGQNEVIKRFFKGIFKLRPPGPKYESTWDPKLVLDYFKDLLNVDLSLKILGKKVLTLLALVSGQRIQTLSLIDIRNIVVKKDRLEIKIPDRIKTSKPGKKQPILILPPYKENLNICLADTLLYYLKKTETLRKDIKALFISFRKPFKKVSTQTLGRWVKDMLQECGLDTNMFSAYSTTHASTSAAKRKRVNIDIIRNSAGWTEKSAFATFYDRPIVQDRVTYGQAI